MARIGSIGADGDGLTKLADGRAVYVPFTLPGEHVTAHVTHRRSGGFAAVVQSVDQASADRVEPPCPHFGPCGGCALQHWRSAAVSRWKAGRVADALRQAGFTWEPDGAVQVAAASRRRIDLALRRRPTGLSMGLNTAHTADIVAIPECRILHPRLLALLPSLQDTLDRLAGLRREGSVLLNLLDTGPDLLLRHDAPLSIQDRQRLGAFARANRIPRIASQRGKDPWETACSFGPATIGFAGVSVAPPPGAFLQASKVSEQAIVAAVRAGLPDKLAPKARVADLFAGCGTLTFALAERVRVTAFEGDAEAAASLTAAARTTTGVTVIRRDLARQPLAATELSGFSAIVLDPSYAGAREQMPAIAASGVRRVIYVSCNPVALGRDAAPLAEAGYRLAGVTAIDQFLWSPHVESVTIFAR